MAGKTKKRQRRAAKELRQQQLRGMRPTRRGVLREPPWTGPDDLDGGAGVREPRRPGPRRPAGAMSLEVTRFYDLDVASRAQ